MDFGGWTGPDLRPWSEDEVPQPLAWGVVWRGASFRRSPATSTPRFSSDAITLIPSRRRGYPAPSTTSGSTPTVLDGPDGGIVLVNAFTGYCWDGGGRVASVRRSRCSQCPLTVPDGWLAPALWGSHLGR